MNPFNTAFLKAPKRSRFDFNHSNTVGIQFGALTPTLSHFIVPGDEVSMSMEQIVRLAPMPVPTFVNMKVRHDFFFVPLRLLYGSEYLDKLFGAETSSIARARCESLDMFTYWFSMNFERDASSSSTTVQMIHPGAAPFVPGTLFDYLGYPVFTDRNGALNSTKINALVNQGTVAFATAFNVVNSNDPIYNALSSSPEINVEKLFAYHFIWRDWYRFVGIQDNTIVESYLNNGILSRWNDSIYSIYDNTDDFSNIEPSYTNGRFHSYELGLIKYAHLTKDMFTSVRYGSKPTVLIPSGAGGTIPALREASALQRYLDIISITGQRYFDKVKGLFGIEPEGPKDDRVQFLGRYQQFIKVGEVLTTATTSEAETGDYAGRGILLDGKYIFKRRFTEHGWLFCITSVIPNIAYNGLHRELTDVYPIDSPLPSLAEVGDQTVFSREVFFGYAQNIPNNASFGDQFRYYAYKSLNDEVHGSFLMDTFRPWSPLKTFNGGTNVIDISQVRSDEWNYLFNDTDSEYIYGDRFFMNLDFYESVTRALPKYINYHL